jgi:hypothetical protein
MWVMSDRAIPRSLRMMDGFGVHTFRLYDAAGRSQFVKFHWRPVLGAVSLLWDEAVKLQGADCDFHRRDLWEAIARGDFRPSPARRPPVRPGLSGLLCRASAPRARGCLHQHPGTTLRRGRHLQRPRSRARQPAERRLGFGHHVPWSAPPSWRESNP